MLRKMLSVLVAMCVFLVTFMSYPAQTANAAANQVNPDDIQEILSDISAAGQAWESIGFSAEDIAEITQMTRKDDSYYQAVGGELNALAIETEETRAFMNSLAEQPGISTYAQDGNPPETSQEPIERLKYVTQVAIDRYGNSDKFANYVFYLYMSHYIDNPNYTKENPKFGNIYAHVIIDDDIRAYDTFVAQSRFSMFSTNLINFVNEMQDVAEIMGDVKSVIKSKQIVATNTADAVRDLAEFDYESAQQRASLIATSFKNHYESEESVANLLDAMYADLEPENIDNLYIKTCVLGIAGMFTPITSLFGVGLSISLCYYNFYMNLYDRATLVALHTSLSGRMAGRLDEIIWG